MKKITVLFISLTIAFHVSSQIEFHSDTMKCETYINEDSLKTLREAYHQEVKSINDNGDTLYKMCVMFNPGITEGCSYKVELGFNKIYYETGVIAEEGFYGKIKKWQRIKKGYFVYYYESGIKREEGAYIKGKREGLWKDYYKNAALKSEEIYKKDLKSGYSFIYHKGGSIKAEGRYVADKKHSRYFFRPFARKRSRKIGVWIYYNENSELIDSINWNGSNK
jgi:antitoxin component YwqK of YwqJK toxin-antitoxin module